METEVLTDLKDRLTASVSAKLAFPSSNQLVFLGQSGHYEVRNTDTGTWSRWLIANVDSINHGKAELSFDGQIQSVRRSPRQIEFREVGADDTPKLIVQLPETQAMIWSVAWHPSAHTIAIGDAAGALSVWKLDKVNEIVEQAGLSAFFPKIKAD